MDRSCGICVVIPTYNNERTLARVVDSVLEYTPDVIVVNDGSTDTTTAILTSFGNRIEVVSYAKNRGKGYALSRGFDAAVRRGFSYALTIDSDGQHFADDISHFVEASQIYPGAMIIGSRNLVQEGMPAGNTFANKFSNFWFTVQTARRLPDTQTGFRLYPLHKMKCLRPVTSRYEAELEVLVRLAWRNVRIMPIPIKVTYSPDGERVTHFRPGVDFVRISMLNTVFVILAVIYGYPSMGIRKLLSKSSR